MTVTQRRILIAVLVLLALLFIAVGVIYAAEPARKLPHILGRIKKAHFHRSKRELLSFVVGIVLLLVAAGVGFAGRRSRRVQELPE